MEKHVTFVPETVGNVASPMKEIDDQCEAARKRMGATKAIRLAAARERSRVFNAQAEADFIKQKLTVEDLARRCTL